MNWAAILQIGVHMIPLWLYGGYGHGVDSDLYAYKFSRCWCRWSKSRELWSPSETSEVCITLVFGANHFNARHVVLGSHSTVLSFWWGESYLFYSSHSSFGVQRLTLYAKTAYGNSVYATHLLVLILISSSFQATPQLCSANEYDRDCRSILLSPLNLRVWELYFGAQKFWWTAGLNSHTPSVPKPWSVVDGRDCYGWMGWFGITRTSFPTRRRLCQCQKK